MKDSVTVEEMRAALDKVGAEAAASAERLRQLDAAAGDGDLGVTMTVGWGAVREALPGLGQGDLGSLLAQAGMTFNRAAASTFGVLLATALMRAGRELRGMTEARLPDVIKAAEAAFAGVKERGKADVGDKTMLDALDPAIAALKETQAAGKPLSEALDAAAQAAMRGAEATAGKTPKFGRASWLGPRAAEVQDPGATAVAIMLQSLAEALQ
ncbi:MAG: DAK2 domain-containing protein [Anaerolineae bacterium]|nr:DAK2 domain-containing protein [Anaerolineae bacterium]